MLQASVETEARAYVRGRATINLLKRNVRGGREMSRDFVTKAEKQKLSFGEFEKQRSKKVICIKLEVHVKT